MGLFNLFKPKKGGLSGLANDPTFKKGMLVTQLEYVKKEVENLRAVGRSKEARMRISNYLKECLQEWKKEPQNPVYLTLIANASISLGELDAGVETLNIVIQSNEPKTFMDLTTVYMDLGRIHHQQRNNPEKEYWAYNMATLCKAPAKCKFCANSSDKAKAHYFAHLCASRINKNKEADFHDKMMRKLVPHLNWDDGIEVIRWIQTN